MTIGPQPTTAADVVELWCDTPMGFGIADDLRCMSMECQELGFSRLDFLEAAGAAGYNRSTASRCWSYTKNQKE